MKNDNFYKTLRIVCLILAIVCMALSLFKKAKAEGIPNDIKTDFMTYINTKNISQTVYNDISSFISQQNYYCFCDVTYNTSAKREVYLIMWNDSHFNIGYNSNSGDNYNINYLNYRSSSGGILTDKSFAESEKEISVILWNNQSGLCATKYTYSSYTTINGGYIALKSASGTQIINNVGYISSTPSSLNSIPQSNTTSGRQSYKYYYSYNFDVFTLTGSSYNQISKKIPISQITNAEFRDPPTTNNTNGFDVYKYGSIGSERLICDFSKCISISAAVANTSIIQININIDGIDQTFNYDSTSTYYDYSVSGSRAIYSIPLTAFGINNDTVSAKLTGVTIVNTTYSPGGSETKNIVWLTPLTLVGSDYEDLEPEVIPKEQMPDFDKFDDEDTQTNYNGTINRWITSGNSSFDYSLYTRWNFEPKYYIVPVIYYGAIQAAIDALKAALNLDFGQAIDDVITIAQGITIEDQIQEFMQENYYLNDLYDIIVFAYEASAGADTVYYIFTTDSYNNHLSNSFLYDVLQAIYDDGKAIEKTYDYLYDRLNDFEDKSLTKLNELVGLQEMENGFFSSLQSILNQILNALLNLNIEVPEADYTDIIDKLDTIIENQDTSDINDDWYQNYREWLYGINENDSYLSPHEYFNNIFGTLKTTFDSFTNNISFNAYLLKVEDFINHISGNTTDNITIYLRDGIGDPGFNINNNYIYTVGGSQ